MTINHLKQFFLLNFILSILTLVFLFKIYAGIEQAMFYIALSGLISSFFIKENLFARYLKLIFFNALFFGFLLSSLYVISGLINDTLFRESFCIHHFYFFISVVLLTGLCNFLGGLIGIVPKGLIERLKTGG